MTYQIKFETTKNVREDFNDSFHDAQSQIDNVLNDLKSFIVNQLKLNIDDCEFKIEFVEFDSSNVSHSNAYYLIVVKSNDKNVLQKIVDDFVCDDEFEIETIDDQIIESKKLNERNILLMIVNHDRYYNDFIDDMLMIQNDNEFMSFELMYKFLISCDELLINDFVCDDDDEIHNENVKNVNQIIAKMNR